MLRTLGSTLAQSGVDLDIGNLLTMSFSLDDPPNSRLFIVAGRNTSVSPASRLHQIACIQPPRVVILTSPSPHLQAEFLRSVFDQYGSVSFVKYLQDKGAHQTTVLAVNPAWGHNWLSWGAHAGPGEAWERGVGASGDRRAQGSCPSCFGAAMNHHSKEMHVPRLVCVQCQIGPWTLPDHNQGA